MKIGFVYLLECTDGSFYTGSTIDLRRRLFEHAKGEGANHTRKQGPCRLVYVEIHDTIAAAFYREKQVQGWSRAKKKALIDGDLNQLKTIAKRCF
jgi:putative endonuclease